MTSTAPTIPVVCRHERTSRAGKRARVVATMVQDEGAGRWYDRGDTATPVEVAWVSDGVEHLVHERTALVELIDDELAEPLWREGQALGAEVRDRYVLRCVVCSREVPIRGERLGAILDRAHAEGASVLPLGWLSKH